MERILPGESSYSFDDDLTDLRLDETDDTYESSCFVSGGGKQLLVATAEMAEYDCRHLSVVVELEQQGNAPSRLSS
ncbi:hypothetical protein [Streptomyces camelliae]|uniref:Uncharacterized protein n=1 Tax=Streptomyces camelliae TaxID=3004093 RepID=A0ABY7P174_9ACTN|nr:hypothetical protein [Streptomyces sp. HUAS 2-6]WBO63482.1 hypothetical protein O1G22_11915 [Streptomyces sp. HUAS 2-6]